MGEKNDGKGTAALVRMLHKLNLIPTDAAYDSESGKPPLSYFESLGFLKEREAALIVAEALSVPFREIDRTNEATISGLFDNSQLSQYTLTHWRAINALPLHLKENRLQVLFANPLDHESKRDLEFSLGLQIIVAMGQESQILGFLEKRMKSNTDASLTSLIEDTGELSFDAHADLQLESHLKHEDVSAPLVIRLVDKIFSDSIERRASDIHVTPEKDKLSVKIRVDGILQPLMNVPPHLKNPVVARIKLLCGMDIAEKRKPQDGRLRLKSSTGSVDLRLSTVPSVHGENVVVRVLSSGTASSTLEQLGLSQDVQEKYTRALRGSSKVVLVAGPTGSGKTSTLYAGLRYLADGKKNIITIEDPIEYRIDGITQIQVHTKVGMGFAEGLRSTLRQDPDVIMVGEIRDLETASIAMQAAQTGHLVLSTIHTNSALAGVHRLFDIGVAPYLIASSVSTIIAQRLVRTLCDECAKPCSPELEKRLTELGIDTAHVKEPCGCEACGQTGYNGRTGIFSILEITDSVKEAIRENLSEGEVGERARRFGYRSLWEEALSLIAEGGTSFEEAERVLGPIAVDEQIVLTQGSGKAVEPQRGLAKPKLLLVEDDESTRTVLAMVFRDQMFEVIEACNGVEGLEKVYEHQPSIIVSDLMMPRMSGVEMLQKLKRDTRTRSIPVLMLTAASNEENELRLLEQGADDFVGKTSDSKIMIARVNRLLSKVA